MRERMSGQSADPMQRRQRSVLAPGNMDLCGSESDHMFGCPPLSSGSRFLGTARQTTIFSIRQFE
jgi:hypothetical protein